MSVNKGQKGKVMKRDIDLEALQPLDVDSCEDLMGLLDSMAQTSFGARNVGRAWSVLKKIVDDPDCALILTLSGAMTVAKLGRIVASLISKGVVKAVITTGAVVTHSLVEELGMFHYKAPAALSDEDLYSRNLNRIYDSIEPESNLETLEKFVRGIFSKLPTNQAHGSFELIKHISSELPNRHRLRGLLTAAYAHKVNVYVPAWSDSELGLYLFRYTRYNDSPNAKQIIHDPLRDLSEYGEWMLSKKHIAFLTLGGGVPRNWAQQMLPFLKSQAKWGSLPATASLPKPVAAVRICPDSADLGHLSGSTYSEAITWGKFESSSKPNLVEVQCDATIVFPILAKSLLNYVAMIKK
jgi:deoxyhypusine synthase